MTALDPLTEQRLQDAFSTRCVVSARVVARIVGIDYARVLEDVRLERLNGATYGSALGFTAAHVRLYLARTERPATAAGSGTASARKRPPRAPKHPTWSERRSKGPN